MRHFIFALIGLLSLPLCLCGQNIPVLAKDTTITNAQIQKIVAVASDSVLVKNVVVDSSLVAVPDTIETSVNKLGDLLPFKDTIPNPVTPINIVKYGYIGYESILKSLPEYKMAEADLMKLKEKYDDETEYNEKRFTNMFIDFLNGQKNFPESILLKRQKELQIEMEKGMSFRDDVKRLLDKAEDDLIAPIILKLDSAIQIVGEQRGYEYILNTDGKAYPFIQKKAAEDASPFVVKAFTEIH